MLAFAFDGDRLALDFVGTVGDRHNASFERLATPEDLRRWLAAAGLGSPRAGEADLRAARELREAIYRAVRAAMAGQAPRRHDLDVVNRAARRPPLVPKLGGSPLRVDWAPTSRVSSALSTVARDAIDLLGATDIGRVRECAASNCSLLFIDDSHAQRRRWCSMARCGNRNKTAAYRRRQARTAGPSASDGRA
jgi:predicted RNA-binding Zn ribbon-like protein